MVRKFHKISSGFLPNGYKQDDFELPKRGTAQSAGYDLISPVDITLEPGEEIILPLGISAEMNTDEFLMIVPRSGSGFKHYIRLANTAGIIDADYFGNQKNGGMISVKIRNESGVNNKFLSVAIGLLHAVSQIVQLPDEWSDWLLSLKGSTWTLKAGKGLAQGIFVKYLITDDDMAYGQRVGGFGSTDSAS